MVEAASFFINSETDLYGVIGDPIRHSRSPIMLNRAFADTSTNAVYVAFHVLPDQLQHAIEGMRAFGIKGLNVTIPHKEQVMAYLDEIDEGARYIGAVNTIVNRDGKLIGYNTDGIGYVRSLQEETGVTLAGKRILVIGAGGAARGVVYALLQKQPEQVTIVNRTKDRAVRLAHDMADHGKVEGMGWDDLGDIMNEVEIVINTTSLGMHPQIDTIPLDPKWLNESHLVSDLVYNPLKTRFLEEAEKLGCRIHGGLGMFIYQGAYAFEYWTGKQAPVKSMREVVLSSLEVNA